MEPTDQERPLPPPFGEDIPPGEYAGVFTAILRDSPGLNLFDGRRDIGSELLKVEPLPRQVPVLVIDDLSSVNSRALIRARQRLLVRAQYYQGGLHHRISFHAHLARQVQHNEYPALVILPLPPIRRVSNLFISFPSGDKPVFLEIPVAGAPPSLRVLEISLQKLKAYLPGCNTVFPKARELSGMRVEFIDLGEVMVSGKASTTAPDQVAVEFKLLEREARQTFSDYLEQDFQRVHVQPRLSRAETPESAGELPGRPTVLVVEDVPELGEIVETMLKRHGFNVRTVSGGKDALREAHRRPDIILLDIGLPDITGLEVLRKLKSNGQTQNIPVIITTAYRDQTTVEQAAELGIAGYLVKPYDEAATVSRIQAALAGRT